MALKDWKKTRENTWKKEPSSFNRQTFKTKSQALAHAMAYMRKY